MISQDKKIQSSPETVIMFLGSILDKAKSYTNHIDLQINILIGICSGLLILTLPRLQNDIFRVPIIVLITAIIIAIFICILAIHPPHFMRKRGQEESLLYNKKITSFHSAHAYAEKLREAVDSSEEVIDQFALEIYNSYKYYYQPKRRLFKISRSILIYGLSISLIVYLVIFWSRVY